MKIKSILFDLDNTLYEENDYLVAVFDEFFKLKNIKHNIVPFLSNGFRLNSSDIFGDILKKLNIYSSTSQLELFHIYKNLNTNLNLYDSAYILIDNLKKKNIKLGIITNGVAQAQQCKIKCLKIANMFDVIIYARKWGKSYEKPNKKPFDEALKILNFDKSEVLFVGDNPLTDILGAENAGIKSIRFINGYMKNIKSTCINNIKDLYQVEDFLL